MTDDRQKRLEASMRRVEEIKRRGEEERRRREEEWRGLSPEERKKARRKSQDEGTKWLKNPEAEEVRRKAEEQDARELGGGDIPTDPARELELARAVIKRLSGKLAGYQLKEAPKGHTLRIVTSELQDSMIRAYQETKWPKLLGTRTRKVAKTARYFGGVSPATVEIALEEPAERASDRSRKEPRHLEQARALMAVLRAHPRTLP
jgi:hypothetical protein